MKKTSDFVANSIKGRMLETLVEQKEVYRKIREGKPLNAEMDNDRKVAFINRQVGVSDEIANRIANYENPETMPISEEAKSKAESIQGATIDFMAVFFLDLARAASRSIARIIFPDGRPEGTGFMISPQLFLTNNHVISNEQEAANFLLEFNYEEDYRKNKLSNTIYTLDPGKFFVTAPEDDLDFTIVAIGQKQSGSMTLGEIGYLPLFESSNKHINGIFVNCIQHPNGNPKQLVVRENRLLARTNNTLIYSSDTMPGSSGSPIFNDDWEVIALHHWGEPYRALTDNAGELPKNGNEGIRASSIVKYLQALNTFSPQQRQLINEALLAQFRQPSLMVNPFIRKEESSNGEMNNNVEKRNEPKNIIMENISGGQATFTIPLTVTIQLGTAAQQNGIQKETKKKTEIISEGIAGAEKFEPDPNYGNRKGYNPDFLGIKVPVPKLSTAQKKLAAKNLKAKTGEDPYEFKYQHFSVFMNGKRRVAYFTAVNIDGGSVIKINRTTGAITRGPEAMEELAEGREKWYDDARIKAIEVCEDKLYDDEPKMSFFHRGHLVKRTDPSWGTETKAVKGQSDTFHFPNCAPQHAKFNPTKNKWAGLEDWITNTSDDDDIRVSVFSGPIFAANDPKISYLQIPKAFWKVVVWSENGKLRSTGIIADQSKLLKDSGLIVGESMTGKESLDELPDKLPVEYHCSIKFIEGKTKLKFGDLSKVDTFKKNESMGGNGFKRITDYTDIMKR